MSFSMNIKNEISKHLTNNSCCQLAELSALIKMTGTIQIHGNKGFGIKLHTENASIARRIFSLIKDNFNENIQVSMIKNKQLNKNNSYILQISKDMGSEQILKECGILIENEKGIKFNYGVPHGLIKKSCCKKAYLKGAFLGGGSVSDPEKNYHLEIVANSSEYAEGIKNLINHFGLSAKVVVRKNSFIVYLKEGEQIVDFLNIIGAHQALLSLENIRIFKEMRNNVNRIVNCETANLSKTVNAAVRQIESIEYIRDKIGLNKLPDGLQQIAEVRLNYQDASLKELGEMLSPVIGKSGVNHRLRKLEQIAESLRGKQ